VPEPLAIWIEIHHSLHRTLHQRCFRLICGPTSKVEIERRSFEAIAFGRSSRGRLIFQQEGDIVGSKVERNPAILEIVNLVGPVVVVNGPMLHFNVACLEIEKSIDRV